VKERTNEFECVLFGREEETGKKEVDAIFKKKKTLGTGNARVKKEGA